LSSDRLVRTAEVIQLELFCAKREPFCAKREPFCAKREPFCAKREPFCAKRERGCNALASMSDHVYKKAYQTCGCIWPEAV